MRARHARRIRAGIRDARTKGWAQQPEMVSVRGTNGGAWIEPVDRLYYAAWVRTMKALGNYPPRMPRPAHRK